MTPRSFRLHGRKEDGLECAAGRNPNIHLRELVPGKSGISFIQISTILLSLKPSMKPLELLNTEQLSITITRLCHELIENHGDFENSAIIGLQPRGIYLANRVVETIRQIKGLDSLKHGTLDITFHRDDIRRKAQPPVPSETQMDFDIEDLRVILIDDVLFTGRTIRAGLDAMLAFGRPKSVELLVLIDRRFSRHLPVQPDYTGRTIDTIASEHVDVDWLETEGEDKVTLVSKSELE